jgi:hypothetical protein
MRRASGGKGPGWRFVVAVLSLLVLAASLTRSLEPAETLARWHRLARGLRGEIPATRRDPAGFWFDPDYAAFLSDLKALTPANATVAVIVPRRPDLYLYQANYQLAPRRVVEERWKDEASFVATYWTEAGRGPGGRPIAGGALWAR